jgi:prolipoprotein diacylglyceryltransferase
MNFPVYIHFGSIQIHPHLFFESLSYLTGFLFLFLNPQKQPSPYDAKQRLWLIAGALMGAALGSKILFWFCDPPTSLAHWNDLAYLQGGKTVVGGLIGGLLGVEYVKNRFGTTASTGDRFVPSILLGIGIGRMGRHFVSCYLAPFFAPLPIG